MLAHKCSLTSSSHEKPQASILLEVHLSVCPESYYYYYYYYYLPSSAATIDVTTLARDETRVYFNRRSAINTKNIPSRDTWSPE